MSRRAKLIIGLIIVVPVLAHLLYALWASPLTSYYLTVGELHNRGAQSEMVRVGGEVVAGSIMWTGLRDPLRFVLTDGVQQLLVVYPGPAPDAFRAGMTAIVEGQLDEKGRFLAHKLLLRCPHQYIVG